MKLKLLLLLVVMTVFRASSRSLEGIVMDNNNEPLPYPVVRVKGKPIGVLGDSIGHFSIEDERIKATDTLLVSYLGHVPMKVGMEGMESGAKLEIRLKQAPVDLPELSIRPTKKSKRVVKGRNHNRGMMTFAINGKTVGDTYGYEFHAKKGKQLLLNKVGFVFSEGERQMSEMKFRINVYDMSRVRKSPSARFKAVMHKPIFFEYTLGGERSGRFEYELPEYVALPEHAMVEIEFLENLGEKNLFFRGNLVGKNNWSKSLTDRVWVKCPFSAPFFVECVEVMR